MVFRTVLSASILLAAAAAWSYLLFVFKRRAAAAAADLEGYRSGGAALVYFSSPVCAPCRAVQRPAVERFKEAVGNEVQVIEVDAAARPDIAERWGVFSLPTTVFLDAAGKPRTVNPGVASTETLLSQARLLRFPVKNAR
jgi:thioredoxin 1